MTAEPVSFEKQYASAYFLRIEMLRQAIQQTATKKWVEPGLIGPEKLVGHVKAYKSYKEDIVLIGVLYKEMHLKPNVLEDIQNNLNVSEQFMIPSSGAAVESKTSDSDKLYLEDMDALLQLVAPNEVLNKIVTGVVVGILGQLNEQSGMFHVHDYVLAGYPSPAKLLQSTACSKYVAFVSGLQLGSPNSNPLALELLKDLIMGASPNETHKDLAANTVRLVVAGDSLYFNQDRDPTGSALTEGDTYLAELADLIPVNVMPGARDPTNYCLPQQPLHSGLFPEARRYSNLTVHPNPYKFEVGNCVFLGTSGQNVSDVLQYTKLESGLDALDLITQSRYIAPTAPDTLACYPVTTFDPLVVTDSCGGYPHVVFAGNQALSSFKTCSDITMVTVSDFSISPGILFIDINNPMNVKMISLSVPKME